jgi:hypothetical protein
MKRSANIILIFLLFLAACSKDGSGTSGTDTINNTTHKGTTYYIYGFTFSSGRAVSTTETPGPDIAVYVNADNQNVPPRLYLIANNFNPSFYKLGEYNDEAAAKTAFDELKTVSVPPSQWTDLADPISNNQIWIYRSSTDKYTKFRIVSTLIDKRQNTEINQLVDYGECTFEWVYQPDGTLTFP